MIDISIIIPSYNRLWCLPQAIKSCQSNFLKIEIIVIDDGSTDGTLVWLKQQPDIILIKQQHMGKCWAVNKGFEVAKGKYIRFLDSDDQIQNLANEEQFVLGENTNADIVVSGYKLFIVEEAYIKSQLWIETDDFIAQQLGECDSSHYSAYLFKKEFITDIRHRPDFAFRDDRLFVLEAALKKPLVVIHNGTALLHRISHPNRLQVTQGLKQAVQHFQHLNIYKEIIFKLGKDEQLTERRINAAINVLWPLCTWIAQSHLTEAIETYDWIRELKTSFKIPEVGLKGIIYRNFGFSFAEKSLRIFRFLKFGWT